MVIANAYAKRATATGTAKPATTTTPAPLNVTTTYTRPTPAPAVSAAPKPYTPSAPPRSAPTPSAAPITAGSTGLHPSWEAARLRKQKEATGPKATKIVFD